MAEPQKTKPQTFTKHGSNNTHSFVYPSILSEGFRFANKNQIKQYLDAESRRASDPTLNTLFKFGSSKNKSNTLRLKCRLCSCFISLQCFEECLVVKSFKNEHQHPLQTTRTKLEDKVFKHLRHHYKKNEQRPTKKSRRRKAPESTFPITSEQYEHLVQKFQYQQLHSFNYLDAMMQRQKCETLLDWGDNKQKVGYPYVIVTATPVMLKNFQKYGDLVCFDVLYHVLKNETNGKKFKVGIFSLMDSNMRILICGVAILCQEVAVNLSKVLEMFFEIQKGKPKTILTDMQSGICNAIKLLQEKGVYRGSHLVDSYHFLQKVRRLVRKDYPNLDSAVISNQIQKLMKTRNQEDYDTFWSTIQRITPPEIVQHFIEMREKITFLDGPRTFIGIRRISLEKINGQMKKFLSKPTTIPEMAKIISRLCTILTNRSNKSFQRIRENYEQLFSDPRILPVKQVIQQSAMQRFIENYIIGKHQFTFKQQIYDKDTDTYMFTLESRVNKGLTQVLDWECRCGEVIRTGIPCPHLMACAVRVPEKKYLEFFDRRWVKVVTEAEKEATDHRMSTMGTKTAGLFRSLQTMYV